MKVHVCPRPGCPELTPCPTHSKPKASGWGQRDHAEHKRFRRAAIKAQPWCTVCGTTQKLDVHHGARGEPVVLCNDHHQAVDSHARAR